MMAFVEVSFGSSLILVSNGCSRIPYSMHSFCNSHLLFLTQVRQLAGCVLMISSRMVFLTSYSSLSCVMIFMPSATGVAQALMILAEPSCLQMHSPQDPKGLRSGW